MSELTIEKGKPFTLPDGTVVLPEADASGSKILSPAEKQADKELQEILADPIDNELGEAYKRTLADVNADPKRMNATMVIVAYSLWGLNEFAISELLNTPIENVEQVKQSDLYAELRKDMIEAVRYAETASIHGYLAEKARLAARVVAGTLTSTDGDRRLKAAQDILDRSGYRPADRVEHTHKFDDELRIVHVTEKPIKEIDI